MIGYSREKGLRGVRSYGYTGDRARFENERYRHIRSMRLVVARNAKSPGKTEAWQTWKTGAGEGVRTLDPDLGKVVLYH
jgi:hypothetical protein